MMGLLPGKLSMKQWLIAAAGVIVSILVVVFWSLNSGPDLPPVSYVPRHIDISLSGEEAISTPPQTGESRIAGPSQPPAGSAGTVKEIPANLSKEEKFSIIKREYTTALNKLRDSYQKEINRLIKCAKEDYLAVKSGQKDVAVSKLTVEYLKLGQALEKDCDSNFYRIMDAMREDLNSNDLPLDLASQAEQEYEDQKSRTRKEILEKITRHRND